MLPASATATFLGVLGAHGLEGGRVQLRPLGNGLVDGLGCGLDVLLLALLEGGPLAKQRVLALLGRDERLGLQVELVLAAWESFPAQ